MFKIKNMTFVILPSIEKVQNVRFFGRMTKGITVIKYSLNLILSFRDLLLYFFYVLS